MEMEGTILWPYFCGHTNEYDAFWSDNLTLNTYHPDLTRCLQDTVLTWIPAAFIVVTGVIQVVWYSTQTQQFGWADKSKLNVLKLIFTAVLWLLTLLQFCYYLNEIVKGRLTAPSACLGSLVHLLGLSFALCLIHLEHTIGSHTSGVQQIYWTAHLITEIVRVRSISLQKALGEDISLYIRVTTYIYFACLCVTWILVFIPDTSVLKVQFKACEYKDLGEKAKLHVENHKEDQLIFPENKSKKKLLPAPETYCSFIVDITYQWFLRLVIKGWRKPLEFDDLPDILDRDKCRMLVPRFQYYWQKELKRKFSSSQRGKPDAYQQQSKNKARPSLAKSLLLAVLKSFLAYNIIRLVTLFVIFANPMLLRQLLAYIESGDPYTWKGVTIALAMFLISNFHTFLIQRFLYHGFNTGMNLRTIATAAVYRKSLRLSSAARKQTTVGEIVNLMSVDAQKLQDLPSVTTTLFSMPILVTISTALIWQSVGPSALAGVAVLAVIMPLNGVWIANRIRKLQGVQMKAKDKRVRTLNEILSGIKVLKLYSWEKSFEEKVNISREQELETIKYINILNGIGSIVWNNATYLISLAIFSTYVLSSPDHILDPNKVFVTFSLVNVLSFPLQLLPLAVNYTGQAIISVQRMNKFLLLEETDEDAVIFDNFADATVKIDAGSFSWGRHDQPALKNISLEIEQGELVAIVGQVGSGKSSLISSMLGEMIKVTGTVTLRDSVSYVAQQTWIQNATLRSNILFGKAFEESRYQQIIDACALGPDLKILSDGDQTEIGEKGINLSGGQKQRVSLARAVYQDSDIYLLDDPLSAVDSHVAKQLFDQVIGPDGLLRHKTRILVTHGVTYLPEMDRIVVMKNGTISETGSYEQLINKQGAFAEFLTTYLTEHPESDSDNSQQIQDLKKQLNRQESGGKGTAVTRSKLRKRSTASASSRSAEHRKSERKEEPLQLIKREAEGIGNIKFAVVRDYAKAGGLLLGILVAIFHIIFVVSLILGQIWLSEWSNDPKDLDKQEQKDLRDLRLGVYGGLIAIQVVSILIGAVALSVATTRAARVFHSRIVRRMLRAPMAFFDTTPLGRIMNRCSKDIDYLDASIPFMVRSWIYAINPLIAVVVIVSYSTPIFLAVMIPIAFLFYGLQKLYISTARQLRRIDAVKRSPIFTHFDESVTGTSSIRAYGRVQEFIDKCDELTDASQRAWYHVIISLRWLGISMEFFGSLVTFSAALFAVLQRSTIGAATAGLSVSYALQIALYMNFFVRASTELETYMVAAERVKEYSELQTEAPYELENSKPEKHWPDRGVVRYEKYSTRYRPELELVLQDVSFEIKSAEKIGIVGRTGAGKSSMALSLFRIIEAALGNIYIDDVKISELGLHNLRSKLTIIPQDPVVFYGSLRFNVDPLNSSSDLELWNSLELAHLKTFVKSLPEGLDYECGENGESLSVGQRQLVCLARALLRKSKILVLDEATSGVDLQTDDLIQETIRSAFKECTVITIAHRINTILDYDRVMVMDQGKIKECGTPDDLLSDQSSLFYALAKVAGITA